MPRKLKLGDSEVTIDTNIPVPAHTSHRGTIYPFDNMLIGESVFLAGEGDIVRYRAAVKRTQRKTEFVFTTRRLVEHGETGLRVWRVA